MLKETSFTVGLLNVVGLLLNSYLILTLFNLEPPNFTKIVPYLSNIESTETISTTTTTGLVRYLGNETLPKPQFRCPLVRGRRIVAVYGSHGPYLERAMKLCANLTNTFSAIDVCLALSKDFLDADFKKRNERIFKPGRGAGYWIWKPYLTLRLLTEFLLTDDVLLYMDRDLKLLRDFEEHICLQAEIGQDFVPYYSPFVDFRWTKQDLYLFLNALDLMPEVNSTGSVLAGFFLVRKSIRSINFFAQWLTYCEDDRLVTDSPSFLLNNTSGFKDHRHDQAVLSLLVKKWRWPFWPAPYWQNFTQSQNGTECEPRTGGLRVYSYNPLNVTSLLEKNINIPKEPILNYMHGSWKTDCPSGG